MFGEAHQFLSFKTKNERRNYWVGRLVQSKSTIRVDLFTVLPPDVLGLVVDLQEEKNGSAFVLVVRWANGVTFPCYQHSVYSHEGEKHVKV